MPGKLLNGYKSAFNITLGVLGGVLLFAAGIFADDYTDLRRIVHKNEVTISSLTTELRVTNDLLQHLIKALEDDKGARR